MTLSEKIVNVIGSYKYEDHPQEVIDKAKTCVLHSFACAFAGINERWSKAARDMTEEMCATGKASVWFGRQHSNSADAAFTNAVYAQSILYEDIHRDSNAHPGVIIIPVAFALGEEYHCNGKEVLNAIVAGYEMMGRVGRGTACPEFGASGFRPTSIIGVFGSAMTASLLLGLTQEQMNVAFSLAASFACGINEWAICGTDDLYFQNGMAARSGIIAAQLAKRGVTAPYSILEGKAGVCTAFGFSKKNLEDVNPYDGKYVINDVLFKPAPACALVQTTSQVALDADRAGIRPEDIDSVVIHTFLLGKTYAGCDNSGPFTALLQARMSNQFNFSASLINKRISNSNYYDFLNPAVNNLASKISLVVDDDYTNAFPKKQQVRVEITLKDGTLKEIYREEPVYLSREDVITKLHEHCEPNLGVDRVDEIVRAISILDEMDDVGDFVKLFIN